MGQRGTFASTVCLEKDCTNLPKFISIGFSQQITLAVKTAEFCHFLIKIQLLEGKEGSFSLMVDRFCFLMLGKRDGQILECYTGKR